MSQATSSPAAIANTEHRTVAICFSSIAPTASPDDTAPPVLLPGLRVQFETLLHQLLGHHGGSLVTAVEDTFIAIFDTPAPAVEFALGLRDILSQHPIAADSQTLTTRTSIHYAPVALQRDASVPTRITGDGVRLAARLLTRVPENAVALSREAAAQLPASLSGEFVEASIGHSDRSSAPAYSSGDTNPGDDTYPILLDRMSFLRLPPPIHEAFPASPPPPAPSGFRGQPAIPPAPAPAAPAFILSPWPSLSPEKTRAFKPAPRRPSPPRAPQAPGLDDLAHFGPASDPIVFASEAIVVIDIVQATATSDLFGWYSVGRTSVRHLRRAVEEIGLRHGLACVKSTGDGLLLTYRDDSAADLAAVHAVQASLELLSRFAEHNRNTAEERRIALRFALHFGEVDVLPGDREGPNVSFTFRVEAIGHASLDKALNPIDPALLPVRDYILCSERVHDIVIRREPDWRTPSGDLFNSCGFFKLKGFTALHEVFLVSGQVSV